MKSNLYTPKPLLYLYPKLYIDEKKLKNLENRFIGPNNEGNAPSECQPLKESELKNIQSQIILPNIKLAPLSTVNGKINTKENDKNKLNISINSSNSKKIIYQKEKKIDAFLLKKRNSINPNENSYIKQYNSFTEENQENEDEEFKNNKPEFSSRHVTSQNNIFNKTIKDYYHTTSIVHSQNKNIIEEKSKNTETIEQLLKKINEQKLIIESKNNEISKLKITQQENENIINDLKLYKINSENEIKQCRLDISNMVKEIGELKREKKKKWIHEQQYNLGKFSIQRISNGKTIDYWEEGEEILEIKNKLEQIKNQKEEIEKHKRKLSTTKSRNKEIENETDSKDLLNFKINLLQKEEQELKEKLNKLEKEKSILIHEINLNNQEMSCRFYQKKEGKWPLLGGRYQIISLLGKGGYSEVYKAYDLESHIYVACKIHQLNQSWKDEIRNNYIKHTIRENQIHKEINHNKIVKHFDTIEIDNNSFCTVLEFCSGPDLATYMKQNKNISEKEAKIIITQILQGLEYLNKLPKKIIHYDLKPENIIFNNMEVKISDFGLAKIIDNDSDKIQLTSQGVGTYWYLPPECFENSKKIDISSKVDIWSCGVILYEMLFKQKPFGQNYSQNKLIKERIMQKAKDVEIPNKPSISEECKEFIKNCLAFDQEDRYDVFQALNSNFIKQDKNKDCYKKVRNVNGKEIECSPIRKIS